MGFGVQPRKRDWQPFTNGRLGWQSTDGHRIQWLGDEGFYLDNRALLGPGLKDEVVPMADRILDAVGTPSNVECPNCGHGTHDNERCQGTADNGANPCACSWPDPSNYAYLDNETITVTCPTSPGEIRGCGHTFSVPRDWRDRIEYDDMLDCPRCGMAFSPDHPNNLDNEPR